jgi:hypothetical protein
LCDEIFLPSIAACEPAAAVQVARLPLVGNGDFNSAAFKTSVRLRLELIFAWIEDHRGEVILVSDVDIRYLQSFRAALLEALDPPKVGAMPVQPAPDLAFQREAPAGGANLGQMLIRCSPAARDFFAAVLAEHVRTGEWDQAIINRMLQGASHTGGAGRTGVATTVLSPRFANSKTGLCPDMLSFHAIGTYARGGKTSFELKLEEFARLTAYLSRGS